MKTPQRHQIIHGVLAAFAVALVAKAAQVQLVQHEKWSAAAVAQHTVAATLEAPRGDIEDAAGRTLAHSRELVRLGFALDVVPSRRALYNELLKAGVSASRARPVLDRARKWYELRQNFQRSRVERVFRLKGVRMYPAGERQYVQSEGTRKLLGQVNGEGKGIDGIELLVDSLLRGQPGTARTLKTGDGRRFDSPDVLTDAPRRGHTVRLTINQGLQDICDQAIADATRRLQADGGDVVILEPQSGAVRCLASHRRGQKAGTGGAATILEPFEPGSTLKPFLIGRLLEEGKVRPEERIATFDGVYEVAGRRIVDLHKADYLTVTGIIQYSSNVGIARLSERVSDGELFQLYRDLGFGTASGIAFPVEASGTLYEPRRWSGQSHASLAIGYELSVTPLQLALAYGAIANGGKLMAPGLIEEIRSPEGEVVYAHRPRAVRHVFEEKTTRALVAMLESVVDSGTATDAGLAGFTLAGKSGTARRTTAGRYGQGGSLTYTSSFVGLFPAKKPQFVVLVKLDNPRGTYYGGKTAAPVTKAVIEAALAARDASLEWDELSSQRLAYVPPRGDSVGPTAVPTANTADVASVTPSAPSDTEPRVPAVPLIDSTPVPEPSAPVRFELTQRLVESAPVRRVVPVPDVRGLPLRVAVRELHRAGFRVQLTDGRGGTTVPAAGSAARTGTTVRLARP